MSPGLLHRHREQVWHSEQPAGGYTGTVTTEGRVEDAGVEALPELAHDLCEGDAELVARVRAAVDSPPSTLEEVGFFGTRGFPPEKNCFLFLITQLGRAGRLISAEDKYTAHLLDTFAEHVGMPPAMRSWRPKNYGWNKDYAALGLDPKLHRRAQARYEATFDAVVGAFEAGYEAKGTPLRMLQFHMGDTLPFLTVSPEVAERWTDVVVARDEQGRPLGLTRPDWKRFFHHVAYSFGWEFADS